MKNMRLLALAALVAILAMPVVAGASAIGVLKNVDPVGVNMFHMGDIVNYKITIQCIEDYPLDLSYVYDEFTDTTQNGVIFGPGSLLLNPGESEDYYFSVEVTPAAVYFDSDLGTDVIRNDVYAEGVTIYPDINDPADGHASRRSPILIPEIVVTKTVDPLVTKAGHDVTYTITVENTGNCDLSLISVDDTILGDLTASFSPSLAIGASETQTFTYTVQTGDPDPLVNTVTFTYEDALALAVQGTDTAEVDLLHPAMTVEQVCLTDPVPMGDTAEFGVTITNTGDVDLIVTTNLTECSGPITVAIGGDYYCVTYALCDGDEACSQVDVLAVLPAEYELDNEYTASVYTCCPCEEEHGEQGCTPGYWKNQTECWECYTTTTHLGDVFTIPDDFASLRNNTLLEALNYRGGKDLIGKVRNLMRHAVAALLNACDADVAYPLSTSGVISDVNDALDSLDMYTINELHAMLDMYNNYGCPQDAHCDPIEWDADARGASKVHSQDDLAEPEERAGETIYEVSSQSSPNPFRDNVQIFYSLPREGAVDIDVFDVTGRHVASLVHEVRSAGTHQVGWNGRTDADSPAPAGVYFYRIRFEDETLLNKMMIMK